MSVLNFSSVVCRWPPVPCALTLSSLCGCLCPNLPLQGPQTSWTRAHLKTSLYHNYLFKNSTFKCCHILRYLGLGPQHVNVWRDTIQPLTAQKPLQAAIDSFPAFPLMLWLGTASSLSPISHSLLLPLTTDSAVHRLPPALSYSAEGHCLWTPSYLGTH